MTIDMLIDFVNKCTTEEASVLIEELLCQHIIDVYNPTTNVLHEIESVSIKYGILQLNLEEYEE